MWFVRQDWMRNRGAETRCVQSFRDDSLHSSPRRACSVFVAGALVFLSLAGPGFAQAGAIDPVAPPEPDVRPLIGESYANDADSDRVDDALLSRNVAAESERKSAATLEKRTEALSKLNALVDVELIFKEQITQAQIDAFIALGGEITYIYEAVSYGWNGRMPLDAVDAVPATMGATLVLVQEPKPMRLHLDIATQCGRVRPIWANNFAGNPSGFNGDNTITIAILDTGVDESHTDLNGRRVYWRDFSSDNAASPIDVVQHGSHVAGIATGTGAAGGSATGTLFYTDSGTLSGVPSGSFYPSNIWIPSGSVTFSSTASWLGGGTTNLYGLSHAFGVSGGPFTALSAATNGASPISESNAFVANPANYYTAGLTSNGSITNYAVANSITNYPAPGDGFNRMSGVAPGCSWAGAKVFTNAGSGLNSYTSSAVDTLVANRVALNIKVFNLSLGTIGNPGLDTSLRQKINTAVNNGIVVCCSAGNDGTVATNPQPGSRQIDDPGRAAMAITVAASNDVNTLTDYTSWGFTSPGSVAGQQEDYKPDLTAPGGSFYYSQILSVDSNSADGENTLFADVQANDYYNISGTSMASPFVAGCSALVIDALQQSGVTWSFASSQHARLVKMLLCATSAEMNANREVAAGANPTLQRAAAGPSGYPAAKDQYEGFGLINPDAAVEAVSQAYALGSTVGDTLGGTAYSKRVWARKVNLTSGILLQPTLTVPAGCDFDLYLYSGTPAAYGTPVILASSTTAATGGTETFSYTASGTETNYLVVKRVSGTGTFSLTSFIDTTPPSFGSIVAAPNLAKLATAVTLTFTASETLTANPTVTVNTHAATFQSKVGLNYTYTYSIQASDPDGAASIAISGTDLWGNNGATTNTTALTVDKTPPSFSAIVAAPNLAKLASIVTITFTSSESLSANPTLTVNTHAAAFQSRVGLNYTYTYTIQASDPDGAASIAISGTDLAGNNGSTTNTTALTVDKTAPGFSSIVAAPSLAKLATAVTITFTASEALSANPTVTVNAHAAVYVSNAGLNYTYTYTIQASDPDGAASIAIGGTDPAGNVGAATNTTALTVDKTAPVFSSIVAAPNPAKLATAVTISFTASEALTANPVVTVNANPAAYLGNVGLNYNYSYTIQAGDPDGAASIAIGGTDMAGNAGSTVNTTALTVDNTPPGFSSIVASPNLAKLSTAVMITFTASEPLAANPTLTVNGHAAAYAGNTGLNYTYTYTVQASDPDGPASIVVGGSDLAGNIGSATNTTALTVDKTPPGFSTVVAAPSLAKLATAVTITFTASEALAVNPSVTVNTHAAIYVSNVGLDYTYTYTIQASDPDGAASVAIGGADPAGNPGSAVNTTALTVDKTAPGFSSIVAAPNLAKLSTAVAITFTASEALAANPAVTVNAHAAAYVSNAGLNYTYTYTIQASDPDGAASIAISGSDPAGNPGSTTNSTALTVDKTAPGFSSIVAAPSLAKLSNLVTITFTASEPLAANPAMTVNAHAAAYVSNAGLDYTYTYAIQASDPDGPASIAISGADPAGNPGSATNTTTLTVDKTAPGFSSVSASPSLAKLSTLVTISFTASETLAANPAVTVNSHAATYQSNAGLNYTYTYAVQASDADGAASIVINGSDPAGNNGSTSNTTALTVDKTAPNFASIAASPSPAKLSTVVTISFTASEPLNTAPGVAVNGHLATYQGNVGTNYTYTYTIQASDPDGAASIAIGGSDLAGNSGSTTDNATLSVDKTPPGGSLSTSALDPVNGAITVNVLLTESSTNFAPAGISHPNAGISGFSGSGTGYSFVLTPAADGAFSASIGAGAFTDAAGNGNTASNTLLRTFDGTPPAATTITPSTPGPTNADNLSFTVTFSEPVQNFNNAADLIVTHSGTASTGIVIGGGPTVYTVTVTGITGDGSFTLRVNTGSDVTDSAGNALASSVTSAPVLIDNIAPAVTSITPATTGPTNAASVAFAVNFDSPVQNFNNAADLVLAHVGTASTGVAIGGGPQNYTVTVNGISGTGSFTLAVNSASDVQDAAGNALASSVTSAAVNIDQTAPSVLSITPATSGPTNASSIAFAVDFTSPVQNFNNAADVTVLHSGTADTGLTITGGPQNYTVTVTGISGSGSFTLAVNTASDVGDLAGNALASSVTSAPVSIDHTAPGFTAIAASPSPAKLSTLVTIRFTASEALGPNPVVMVNGHAASFVSVAGNDYTYAYTIQASDGDGPATIAINGADVAGNTGSANTAAALTVDKTAPSATISLFSASPAASDTVTFDVLFSEPVAPTFTAADITQTGTLGGIVSVSGAGPAYTVTIALADPNADGTVSIGIGTGVTDPAGNAHAGASSGAYAIFNWFGFAAQPAGAQLYTGDSHILSVVADCDSPALTYQWVRDDGVNHLPIAIAGATSPSYTIISASLADRGSYTCEVTYDGETHVSSAADITVENHLAIETQPEGAALAEGLPHTFAVLCSGGYGPLTYAWEKDGIPIPGADESIYSIDVLALGDAGAYRVVVMDNNQDVLASDEAILSVSTGLPNAGPIGIALIAGTLALLGAWSVRLRARSAKHR